ncbi:MAG TPA: hypothetical protein VK869_14000 [Rubrobacteraceae bacterium]|nr:hypothetical protein [Rubrobacteraceae bacterium]
MLPARPRPHVVPIWFDLDGDAFVFTADEGASEVRVEDQDLLYRVTRLGDRYASQDLAEPYGRRTRGRGPAPPMDYD